MVREQNEKNDASLRNEPSCSETKRVKENPKMGKSKILDNNNHCVNEQYDSSPTSSSHVTEPEIQKPENKRKTKMTALINLV